MSSILLAPHGDDETLFAAYSILRHQPVVAVCLQSFVQEKDGIYHSDREAETAEACAVLGVQAMQFEVPDNLTARTMRHELRTQIRALGLHYDHCFAPRYETGGHDQHNLVADLALDEFGVDNVTWYMTYRRGRTRSRGAPVPYEPEWPALKFKAMACYTTQINLPSCQPWFACDWLEEWYAS